MAISRKAETIQPQFTSCFRLNCFIGCFWTLGRSLSWSLTIQTVIMSTDIELQLGPAPLPNRDIQSRDRSTITQRIPALDFTKGALVLFMVLYHWLNYFYGPQGAIYNYLRFLTPSFIFITGFLISYVHLSKYGANISKLSGRLFVRGVKLLALFIALNVLVSLLAPASFIRSMVADRTVMASLESVFITGNAPGGAVGKIAAFGILVPISYLLILASLLLIVRPYFKYIFFLACGLSLSSMVFLDMRATQCPNLELVSVGLLGVVLGYTSEMQVQQIVKRTWVVMAVYSVYVVAITLWEVSYYVQMVGACLTTTLIYVVGVHAGSEGLQSRIVLLGRYSLFGYISQIAILQLLSASLRHVNHGPVILAGSLVAGFVLTMASVEAIDWGRARYKVIDRTYKGVFA
jgi:peptidoglycan/LPS O-acetylase OafA/YrhL